jgi:hypothetical protein
MANKYTKRGSASLAVKEMQSKMALGFHLMAGKMATIKKANNKNCW